MQSLGHEANLLSIIGVVYELGHALARDQI